MSHINVRSQLKQYAQVGAQSGVAAADPHRLVQMLMAGGLDKIASAKGQMERGERGQYQLGHLHRGQPAGESGSGAWR